MADRHCIFAWTETNAPEGFPGYVNISRDENGKHTITVRSRGNAGRDTAIVEIPPEALESLLCDLAADLYRDDADRLMAMPEAEVDAELRRLGIDPADAERQGKAAVEGALETIRARNAGVRVPLNDQQERPAMSTEQAVLNAQWNAASEAVATEEARRAPHVLMQPVVQAENKAALYRRALLLACNGDEDQVAFFVSEAGTAIAEERAAPGVPGGQHQTFCAEPLMKDDPT